jgi:hypothetical protein
MKLFSKILLGCGVLAILTCSGGSAYADGLTLVSPDIQKLVPPISALNFEHQGFRRTEAGGVRWDGSRDVSFGDISAGPHQHTVSLTDLGIGQARDLRVLLNINEANGWQQDADNNRLFSFDGFDESGNSIFTASLVNGPISLEQFKKAQGSQSDYVFGLDGEAAARLQAAIDRNPTLRLGLSAQLSNVDGGRKDSISLLARHRRLSRPHWRCSVRASRVSPSSAQKAQGGGGKNRRPQIKTDYYFS